MNIDEILNMIDDMLEEAWSLPFSGGRCVVDAQKVKECIEDIRLNLPGEIKQAKMIVADRNDIIKSAERQAESALRKAEERARMLIAQEEIVKQAQEKAADIIAQAQMAAKEIRRASHEFSDSILKETEENLSSSLKMCATPVRRCAMRPANPNSRCQRKTDLKQKAALSKSSFLFDVKKR